MRNLRKDVTYSLQWCSYSQLRSICDWLAENDAGWDDELFKLITSREAECLSYDEEMGEFDLRDTCVAIVCATELFTDTMSCRFNVDKEMEALTEASKKLSKIHFITLI